MLTQKNYSIGRKTCKHAESSTWGSQGDELQLTIYIYSVDTLQSIPYANINDIVKILFFKFQLTSS